MPRFRRKVFVALCACVSAIAVSPMPAGASAFEPRAAVDQPPEDGRPLGPSMQLSPQATSAGFESLVPARLLDTRPGTATIDGSFAGGGARAAASQLDLQVTGRGGVPTAAVAAVVLNVTVTEPAVGGYITVWPAGAPRPTASNLNFATGQTIANLVVAKIGAAGKVSIFTESGPVHLIADVVGFASSTGVTALNPERLLDTRPGTATVDGAFRGSGPIGGGSVWTLPVTGRGSVPASGVSAVILNVTVANPSAGGYATVWPTGEARPNASNLNFAPGDTIPNLAIVKVGAGGAVNFFNEAGTTDLIADVVGYFATGTGYAPLSPARLLDTRPGTSTVDGAAVGGGPLGPDNAGSLLVAGRGGVPNDAGAVVLNVTAVAPTSVGYLTVWPSLEDQPNASTLNFAAGQTIPNLVVAKLGFDGRVDVYNAFGQTHVIIDVVGWFPFVADLFATTLDLPPGVAGDAYSWTMGVTGSEPPYTWAADALAPGLGIDASTGTVSGTPTAAGTFSALVTVRDVFQRSVTAPIPQTVFPASAGYNPVTPTVVYNSFSQPNPVAAGSTVSATVAGVAGVPTSNVSAVVLRIVARAFSPGYITAWPSGNFRPSSATVITDAGVFTSNLAVVPAGAEGKVAFYTDTTADLLVDVVGWFDTSSTTHSSTPTRVHDSRVGPGPLGAGAQRDLQIGGGGGVPGSGVAAVLLNVITGETTTPGALTAWGFGDAMPAAPSIRTTPGDYALKFVLAPVSSDGKVSFRNNGSSSTLLIVEVVGYIAT